MQRLSQTDIFLTNCIKIHLSRPCSRTERLLEGLVSVVKQQLLKQKQISQASTGDLLHRTTRPCRSSTLTGSMKRFSNWAIGCQKPPAGLPGLCNCTGQLTVWVLLTMLSSVPPSCCVVTSIWRSPARQISTPVRSLQQALLCKFNYSSVPYYCWLTAPRTNLILTVHSQFYSLKVPHLFLLSYSLVSLKQKSQSPQYCNLSAAGYCSLQRAWRESNFKKPLLIKHDLVKATVSTEFQT